MPTFKSIELPEAKGKTKDLLTAVQNKFGTVPNLFKIVANSPAALEGILGFLTAMEGSSLSPQVREQLALVVASTNSCNYCLAAHNAIGQMCGLTEDAIVDSTQGKGADSKTTALLAFAQEVVKERGLVSPDQLESVRKAGWNDGQILETIAMVAINVFTNYTNHIAGTVVDFPELKIPARKQA